MADEIAIGSDGQQDGYLAVKGAEEVPGGDGQSLGEAGTAVADAFEEMDLQSDGEFGPGYGGGSDRDVNLGSDSDVDVDATDDDVEAAGSPSGDGDSGSDADEQGSSLHAQLQALVASSGSESDSGSDGEGPAAEYDDVEGAQLPNGTVVGPDDPRHPKNAGAPVDEHVGETAWHVAAAKQQSEVSGGAANVDGGTPSVAHAPPSGSGASSEDDEGDDDEEDFDSENGDPASPAANISKEQLDDRGKLKAFAEKSMAYYKEHNGWAERFWNFLRRHFPSFMDAPLGRLFKVKRDIARSCRTLRDIDTALSKGQRLGQTDAGAPEEASVAAGANSGAEAPMDDGAKLVALMQLNIRRFQTVFAAALKETKLYKRWVNNKSNDGLVGELKNRAQVLIGRSFVGDIIQPKNPKNHAYNVATYSDKLVNSIVESARDPSGSGSRKLFDQDKFVAGTGPAVGNSPPAASDVQITVM